MPYSALFGTTLQSHLTKGFLHRPAGGCAPICHSTTSVGNIRLNSTPHSFLILCSQICLLTFISQTTDHWCKWTDWLYSWVITDSLGALCVAVVERQVIRSLLIVIAWPTWHIQTQQHLSNNIRSHISPNSITPTLRQSPRQVPDKVADTNHESPRHKSRHRLSWFVSWIFVICVCDKVFNNWSSLTG